jgi:hypothetical protein
VFQINISLTISFQMESLPTRRWPGQAIEK